MRKDLKNYSLRLKIILKIFLIIFLLCTCAKEDPWRRLLYEASFLSQQGRYSEATEVAEEALQLAEKTYGTGHPNVATSLNTLAEIYDSQAKYDEAEPLYKRSLEIREKAFGQIKGYLDGPTENLST